MGDATVSWQLRIVVVVRFAEPRLLRVVIFELVFALDLALPFYFIFDEVLPAQFDELFICFDVWFLWCLCPSLPQDTLDGFFLFCFFFCSAACYGPFLGGDSSVGDWSFKTCFGSPFAFSFDPFRL